MSLEKLPKFVIRAIKESKTNAEANEMFTLYNKSQAQTTRIEQLTFEKRKLGNEIDKCVYFHRELESNIDSLKSDKKLLEKRIAELERLIECYAKDLMEKDSEGSSYLKAMLRND